MIRKGEGFCKAILYVVLAACFVWSFGGEGWAQEAAAPAVEIVDCHIEKGSQLVVEWKPYPEAMYYSVWFGMKTNNGSRWTLVKGDLKTTHITLPLDESTLWSNTQLKLYHYYPVMLIAQDILGEAYGEKRLYVGVAAYSKSMKTLYLPTKTFDKYVLYKGPALSAADQLLLNRNYAQALQAYEQAIQKNPSDVHSLRIAGLLYYIEIPGQGQTNPAKAREYLARAYDLGKNPLLLETLGELSLQLGDYASVEKYADLYQEYDSRRATARYLRIKANLFNGALDKSEQQLIELLKGYNTWHEVLMVQYMLQGREAEACKVESLYPNSPDDMFVTVPLTDDLKACLSVLKRSEMLPFFEAVKTQKLEHAISLIPNTDTGRFYRALIYSLKEDEAGKEQYLKMYQAVTNPTLQNFLLILGQMRVAPTFPKLN